MDDDTFHTLMKVLIQPNKISVLKNIPKNKGTDSLYTPRTTRLVKFEKSHGPYACTKLPLYTKSMEKPDHQESIIRSLTLHLHKMLSPLLKLMTSWSQVTNFTKMNYNSIKLEVENKYLGFKQPQIGLSILSYSSSNRKRV